MRTATCFSLLIGPAKGYRYTSKLPLHAVAGSGFLWMDGANMSLLGAHQGRVVKPVFVATVAVAWLSGFARLANAEPVGSFANPADHRSVKGPAVSIAVSPDLLSWDDCRTKLDTHNGRELVEQQRVMDYCLGMERGREAMREELHNFPGRATVSTEPISIAPLFMPSETGMLPTALIGR